MDVDPPAHSFQPRNPTDAHPGSRPTEGTLSHKGKGKETYNKGNNDTKNKNPIQLLATTPPVLSSSVLRSIVNIVDAPDCSSKTFHQAQHLIQNLSHLSGAREDIVAELQSRTKSYGIALYSELDELELALAEASDAASAQGTTLSKFSPASSNQARFLRLLKTIDYTHTSMLTKGSSNKHNSKNVTSRSDGDPDANEKAKDEQKKEVGPGKTEERTKDVQAIYESFQFEPLWEKVGNCLTIIAEKSDLIHIATILLPLIEALLVIASSCGIKPTPGQPPPSPTLSAIYSSGAKEEDMETKTRRFFFDFTEKHRTVLNLMVRNNPSLMSGSFAILVHNPSVLEFDNKRNFFNQQLHRRPSREQVRSIQIACRRDFVFSDSFHNLMRYTGDEVKYGKLHIRFRGEEGVDAGGVTREWFQVLAVQMFNPDYALFQPCAADKLTYQPNKLSSVNPDHLSFFRFVGRVIGKAIYDNRLLDAYFTRSFYKHMLGRPVQPSDLESVDPDYYKSVQWMLENDIEGIIDNTFTAEDDALGVHQVIDLKPNGSEIPVTNENKGEYVRLATEYKLTKSIREQIDSFLEGFWEIVPKDLIQIFTDSELELLISGLPDIDVDEWRANTTLQQFNPNSTTVSWFWRAVRSFNQEERAKLLQFSTGTSRVPLEGFGSLQGVQGNTKFTLTHAHKQGALPTAHTCFNQLDMPDYSSYEELRDKLLQAITLGATGFGFA